MGAQPSELATHRFTEDQEAFRDAYRRFLEGEIAPNMEQWRSDGIVDRDAFRKAGDNGFLMVWPDEEFGGIGDRDFRYEQIIIEETIRADCQEWFNTLHSRLVGPYIDRFGSKAQKRRFLPGCVSGEKILAIAMTEPDAGSDLSRMRATLMRVDDGYVLNGSKTYISNGINADFVIVAAKTDPEGDPHKMALCIVERGMDGFTRGNKLEKIGMKAQDTAGLFFEDVQIPEENILGEIGKGFHHLMHGLAEERLIAATQCTCSARVAFDETRQYALDRKMFGKRLSDMQNTQFKMAEMDARIEVLEVFLDHCVALHNVGKLTAGTAAKAKLIASETEWQMIDLGVQMHGGAGYMSEYKISRMFRDSRVNRIWAGASEIMKLIIGRDVFSDKYDSRMS